MANICCYNLGNVALICLYYGSTRLAKIISTCVNLHAMKTRQSVLLYRGYCPIVPTVGARD